MRDNFAGVIVGPFFSLFCTLYLPARGKGCSIGTLLFFARGEGGGRLFVEQVAKTCKDIRLEREDKEKKRLRDHCAGAGPERAFSTMPF